MAVPLLLAILATLLCACPARDEAERQAESGDPVDAVSQEQTAPAADLTELNEYWDSLPAADRSMLEEEGRSLDYYLSQYGDLDRGLLKALVSNFLAMRRGESESGGKGSLELEWQFLDIFSGADEDYAVLSVGNFDDDPAQELLHSEQYRCRVLELDGSARELPVLGWDAIRTSLAWDWDGDGVDELVATAYAAEGETNGTVGLDFVRLDGTVAGSLNGRLLKATQPLADYDGDGRPDLIYDEGASRRIVGLASSGREIWSTEQIMPSVAQAVADLDGDGLDELLAAGAGAEQSGAAALRAFGSGQEPQPVPGLTGELPGDMPVCAADLDGDGTADLLTQNSIIFPASGKRVELELPDGRSRISFGAFPCKVLPLRRSTGTLFAVLILESEGSHRFDALLLWDAAGRLVYSEKFDAAADGLYAVWDGSEDRLVLRTEKAILVERVEEQ
ncbi:MAG: VCBS repeat-containing protein [bacterium]